MNTRIKEIRNVLGLTQTEFGERIGFSRPMVANLEGTGRAEIKEHTIHLICKEYNVDKNWLLTGEGEMFVPVSRDDEIAKFTATLLKEESDSFKNRLVSVLAKMTEEEWEMLEKKMREVLGE